MKKTALLLILAVTILFSCKNGEKKEVTSEEVVETVEPEVIDEHTSENALDWPAVYEGITPCADCEGIDTIIELKSDKTFTLSQTYLGKKEGENKFSQTGNFEWNQGGTIIRLQTESGDLQYKVGENQLWMLDANGDVIEGDLAEKYILKKTM